MTKANPPEEEDGSSYEDLGFGPGVPLPMDQIHYCPWHHIQLKNIKIQGVSEDDEWADAHEGDLVCESCPVCRHRGCLTEFHDVRPFCWCEK